MTREPSLLEAVTGTVGTVVKDGVSFLTDLLRRVLRGLRSLAPVGLGAGLGAALGVGLGLGGCDAEEVDDAPRAAATAAPAVVVEQPPVEDTPKPIGQFNITFYYMIGEDEVGRKPGARSSRRARTVGTRSPDRSSERTGERMNDRSDKAGERADRAEGGADAPAGELAAIHAPEKVTIYEGGSCDPIAHVSKEFAAQLALQGTGKLRDGRVVNVWGHCDCDRSPCFKVTSARWGTAGNGRPLQPYRTVAVDPRVIKLGSLLYVPALEGRTMPGRPPWGGYVHDGCVVADDVGGAIKGKQLDLFVGRKGHYHGISGRGGSHAWARNVDVFDGSTICERDGRKVARKSGAI